MLFTRILPTRWTDSIRGSRVRAVRLVRLGLRVIANAQSVGAGDGTHAGDTTTTRSMSRAAIAAALALEDVAGGERLVAFGLASFANRERLAWPGTALAAARAALSRSRYIDARNQLVKRGLIEIVDPGGGRARSAMLHLRFAEGPRLDAPINAELFETVLSYSRTSGPARLLLASIAALSDDGGQLDGVAAGELRVAACLARSTYRRARAALITSGEIELVRGKGGRGNTNRWRIPEPQGLGSPPEIGAQRRAPSRPARPLMAAITSDPADAGPIAATKPAHSRPCHRPTLENAGSAGRDAQGRTASAAKGVPDRTVSPGKERSGPDGFTR